MTLRLHHLRLRRPVPDLHRCHQITWESAGSRVLWAQPLPDVLLVLHDGELRPPRRDVVSFFSHDYRLDYLRGERIGFSLIACPTRMDGRTRARHSLPPGEREAW